MTEAEREAGGRRRLLRLSAAALAVAGAVFGVTVLASSSPGADARATKALVATAAATSGTMTLAVLRGGSTHALEVTRWNGDDVSLSAAPRTVLGPNRELLVLGGGAYLRRADGSWLRYATRADLDPRLGPAVQLAHDNAAGNTAARLLALATGLRRSMRLDGTSVYTGTIRNGDVAIAGLGAGSEAAGRGARTGELRLELVVGRGGLLQQLRLGPAAAAQAATWSVRYSRLGSTPKPTAPGLFALAEPGIVAPSASARRTG